MAIVNTLKIYESLKSGMNETAAKAVSEAIEQSLEEYRENQKEFLATKEDVANLRTEMANMRADLIKWMFIFWAGQIGAMIAIFAIMK